MHWTDLAALISVALILLVGVLWRRMWCRARAREQLWLDTLEAIARRDYNGTAALVMRLDQEASRTSRQKEAAITLRRIANVLEAMEAREREEHRARGDLEDVLAALQDAVLVVDDEARLRFLNAAALQFFQVRVQDVLGAQLLEALPSFGLDAAVRESLQEGKSSAREVQIYALQGREVFLRVTPLRREDGQVAGAVAILQDLTEMRRLERVRRDFVANASHELRTPIANIRAAAETMLHAPEDPELLARFLPQMIVEAERQSHLVSDLLDLARTEAPEQPPYSPVALGAIIHNAVERLHEKARSQNIQVHCDCAEDAHVNGDAAGLEQVVFNLLDNALAYTPPDGHVRLTCVPEGKKVVTLAVSDTGIGIPADDLPRIFERFYRIDKARSRSQGGTGLGLAIVKHIVENHNGHIQVESEMGQGTTFTVSLPAA